jgi:phage/plasmid-associated DNA primase
MKASFSADEIAPRPTLDRLKRLYDGAWTLNSRGSIGSINPRWWAGLFHLENDVLFCQREGFFLFDEVEGIYAPISPDYIRERVATRLLHVSRDQGVVGLSKHAKVATLAAIILHLRGIAEVKDPFDGHKGIMALENGVLILSGGKVRFEGFSAKFRVRDRIAVRYDPKAKCPRYDKEFIGAVLGPDDVDLLHRQSGLILAGVNPSHRLGILEGASGAGKSTYLGIVTDLVGISRTVQLRTEHLDQPFEMSAFHGRTFLTAADVGDDFLSTRGAHTLKGLVSADLFYPESKNSNERKPLRGPFGVLIGTNCRLVYRSQGDADAWRRRLIIYEWQAPPADRKRTIDFGAKLIAAEGSGILNRMIAGYQAAWRELEDSGDLVLNDEQRARVENLVMRSEAVETFVKTRLEVDPGSEVSSEALVEAFFAWCAANGWTAPTERQVQLRLPELILEHWGVVRCHRLSGPNGRLVRGWRGIRLVDDGSRSFQG